MMLILSCRTRELPTQLPVAALHKLIARSTSTWEQLSLDLLENLEPVLVETLDSLAKDIFGKYGYGGLLQLVKSAISALIRSVANLLAQSCMIIYNV